MVWLSVSCHKPSHICKPNPKYILCQYNQRISSVVLCCLIAYLYPFSKTIPPQKKPKTQKPLRKKLLLRKAGKKREPADCRGTAEAS